jgi:hypothetical protein
MVCYPPVVLGLGRSPRASRDIHGRGASKMIKEAMRAAERVVTRCLVELSSLTASPLGPADLVFGLAIYVWTQVLIPAFRGHAAL